MVGEVTGCEVAVNVVAQNEVAVDEVLVDGVAECEEAAEDVFAED